MKSLWHNLCIRRTSPECLGSRTDEGLGAWQPESRNQPGKFDSRERDTNAADSAGGPDVGSAADYLPEMVTVDSLRTAEQACRGCELYNRATQAVAGEGPASAKHGPGW